MTLQICATVSPPADVDGERALVERAKYDSQAFGQLYRRYYPVVAGYVYRRVGDRHATEDLVAEVFLTALRYLPRYRHRGVPVRAWFYRIASNTVNRWARRQSRNPLWKSNGDALAGTPAQSDPAPDGRAERARRALLSLSPKYQTVLALHYLERMTVDEVARALGCRAGTVKSRLSRGREALREKLQQRR
ncbi:MAG TPA: RNA polymerase sigma factor [Phycisphaerae bacterium]|nr:RNA polymerase sigma factor [Phycisphaerae bacterium]